LPLTGAKTGSFTALGEILAGQKVLRSCTACFLPLTGAKTGSFTAFSSVLRSTTVVVLHDLPGYNETKMTPTIMQRESFTAKVWLNPVHLQSNQGFRAHEIRIILKMVEEHRERLLEAWNEYFSN
jgi:hypothetical protein